MAYFPPTGSVVAFQSQPSSLLVGASIVGLTPVNVTNMASPSVVVIHPAGSVVQVRTDNASVIAVLSNSSVTALQGTNPWQINVPTPSYISYQAAGSVMAVSGSFSASPQSSINALQLAGSILAVNVPTPSYISYQLAGSIMAVAATVNTGNSSVQLLQGVAAIGSVAVLQGTNPWQINMPSSSVIAYQLAGSIMAVAATVNTGNSSVQLLGGVAVIGSVATLQGTNPWFVNDVGSVLVAIKSTAGSVLTVIQSGNSSVTGTMSVLGTVPVTQSGAWVTSLVSTVPSSVMVGASIFGTVPVTQTTSPWVVNVPTPSYIAYQLAGSVMAVNTTVTTGPSSVQLLSTSASIVTTQNYGYGSVMLMTSTNASVATLVQNVLTGNSSVQLISTSASIIANHNYGYSSVMLMASTNASVAVLASQGTNPWVIGSIVGTYAEDSGHVSGDKGLLAFGVRNDTVASLVNADLDYGAWAQDSAGRHLIKPFAADETTFRYSGSIVSGSVTLIAPSVIGKRNYITDFRFSNTGSVTTLITFQDGSTSIIGYTIAPAGGGSNWPGVNVPERTATSQDLAFKMATMSSVLYATINGYTAP